jgi:acyl-CoA reductase-like NAD-dependent aldehyde dehydrogenase
MAGHAVSPTVPAWGTVRETFESLNPATGEVLATYGIDGQREVGLAVRRARGAAAWWGGLSHGERKLRLLAWKSHLTRYMGRLAQLVHDETGKPLDDATLEIVNTILHLDWAARHAAPVLRPRRVPSGIAMLNQAASVEYQPLGVIGVIGPWNYPVFTPMGSIGYALAAGNAVVFKPSELTTGVGQWLVQSFTEVLIEVFGETEPVLQLVTGRGATGAELARSGVNKLAFTGSAATARKVLAAAAETLTPVLAECGGKDALLVDADADLDAAADAAAWGAMSNAGQTCVGVERVYVVESAYHAFLDKLGQRVAQLRPGEDASAAYGPMTLPGQVEVVERHLADAVARGGRPAFGGLDSVRAPFVSPVVLVDVPEDSAAVREETFGPVVTVTAVPSLTEAVRLANASSYALGSAVFARRRGAALRAARALRSGMTSVNSVISFAAVPALPFGGTGESGFGRIHGADGLREFSRAKSITRQRMKPVVRTTTFSRTATDMDRIVKLVTVLHGRLYGPARRRQPRGRR